MLGEFMPTGAERSEKYAAKFDPEAVRLRFTAVKALAEAKQAVQLVAIADKQAAVRGILDAAGISPMLAVLYQSFSNKCYGIARRFTGTVRTNEITYAKSLWVSRGALAATLHDIGLLYGVSV